jgi:Right handed beta helix region
VFDSNVLVSGTPAAVVSISGFDPVHPARQVRFVNNTVTGGLVEGADAHDVTIAGNTIEAGERPRPVVRFRGSYEGLRIENNTLSSPLNDESEGIHVSALGGATPARVRVTGNDIDVGGIGIVLENVGSFVDIDHNRILGRHKERGVLTTLRADTVHQSLRVTDNTITNFAGTAIDVSRGSSTDTIVGLIITGNHLTITDDTPTAGLVGIGLRSDHGDQEWAEKPVIAGNSINQNIPIQIFKGPGVAVTTIAGNTGRVAIYEGDSDPGSPDHSPEGHIIAAPGSLFLQNNPEPATLYYKTNGTADTGWTQLELTPTS